MANLNSICSTQVWGLENWTNCHASWYLSSCKPPVLTFCHLLQVFVTDTLFSMYCRPTDTELTVNSTVRWAWRSALSSMCPLRHMAATWASNTLLSLGIILNSDITKKKKNTKKWETQHWTDHKATGVQCEQSAALCKVSWQLHSGDSSVSHPVYTRKLKALQIGWSDKWILVTRPICRK